MKKLTSLVTGMLFAVSSFTLVACSDAEQSQPKTSETTQASTAQPTDTTPKHNPAFETIHVALSADYPPYEFKDEKGMVVGFDVDLLNAVAEKAKLNAVIVPVNDWNGMFEGVKADKHELVISALARNAEREQNFELSNSYMYSRDTIVTKEGKPQFNTLEELKNVRVATQAGTNSANDIISVHGQNNPNSILVNTNYLALAALIQDKADAIISDESVMKYHINHLKDVDIKFNFGGTGSKFERYEMVWLAKKGNTDLINKLNDGLAQVVADGTYAKIYEKWLGVAPTPEQMPKVTP